MALSRARNGFFLLGNLRCLASTGVPVWEHVKRELGDVGRVGHAQPLHCPVHGVAFRAASADDIRAAMGRCCLCAASAPAAIGRRAAAAAAAAARGGCEQRHPGRALALSLLLPSSRSARQAHIKRLYLDLKICGCDYLKSSSYIR